MKIIDCFIYNNEDLVLDLRLNSLNEYVDKFVIVESLYYHSGIKKKNYNLDLNKFKNYKHKIEYLQIEKFPEKFSNWQRENFHRNYISNALSNLDKNDFIIISDIDEIPNLDNLDNIIYSKEKYTAFEQKMFYYKFNLINITENKWYGSKMCKLKYLKSPQWLRNKKVKNYPFFRFDKIKWNIVENGGWHFSNIMSPEQLSEKIKSFAHSEFNKSEFTDVNLIRQKIEAKKDIFGRNFEFKKFTNENELPKYIQKNKLKFSEFLI